MKRELICGDCLDVFDDGLIDTASIDLIYLDPPFNSQRHYNLPFSVLGKEAQAVEAFKDIWHWDEHTMELYERLSEDPNTLAIRNFIDSVRELRGASDFMGAYLVNMAIRLHAMKRVLKSTGSIFLHCDPTASHYLKLLLDNLYGHEAFRNEIIWGYTGPGSPGMRQFNRKHDCILWYVNGKTWTFNADDVRMPHKDGKPHAGGFSGGLVDITDEKYEEQGKVPETWWTDIAIAPRSSTEYLGYPTQKPRKLLDRILSAASNEGDIILDPFSGCGTSIHTAETLGRQWIGIDISTYAIGVQKNLMLGAFKESDIKINYSGIPLDLESAEQLAKDDPFEFEKWACGQIGSKGLYKNLGSKGADGGIDGVIEFAKDGKKISYGVVQVKGGKIKPNDVKALYADVSREPKAEAGVFICFDKYKKTFENNRSHKTFVDALGNEYPVIQLVTVEQLLAGVLPRLPMQRLAKAKKVSRQRQRELEV